MNIVPSKVAIIQAILTNQSLTEDEKGLLIDEFINEIKREYPDLKYHATKSDIRETELQLTKEIEATRYEIKELDVKLTKDIKDLDAKLTKDIKELDVKLTKEIKDLDAKLTKEIEATRYEIKELDVKLTKEIKDLDVKLTKEIKDLDVKLTTEIANSKSETIKWVAGMLFVQVLTMGGIFLAAFKLFTTH